MPLHVMQMTVHGLTSPALAQKQEKKGLPT
jgi:hypothetical protein